MLGHTRPKKVVLTPGQNLKLSCFSIGTVLWLRDNILLFEGHNLLVSNIKKTQSGSYVCHGKKLNGKPFTSRTLVRVNGK